MKKKRTTLIICIALLLLPVFIITVDFLYFCSFGYRDEKSSFLKLYIDRYNNKSEKELIKDYIYNNTSNNRKKFRKVENNNSNKEAVIIFGDIVAYGLFLKDNETFSYYLGQKINNPIYNRAHADSTASHLYYQLSNEEFYKIVPLPQYIFYIYTPEQMIAIQSKLNFCQHQIYYKLQNAKLIRQEKVPFFKKMYLVAGFNNLLLYNFKYTKPYYLNGEKLFKELLLQSKQEIQRHYGNDTKFVIIRYYKPQNKIEDKIFKDLKEENFIIFNLYDYMDTNDKKYFQKNSPIPNSEAMEKFADIISQKFVFN